jgi:hypothetical protein
MTSIDGAAPVGSPVDVPRPPGFPMKIQGGMLEALGINMYTTLGKCLVEFVANSYDGDASKVTISIPVDEIQTARAAVRAAAKAEVATGDRDPFKILLTPLDDAITVVVADNGHGMSPSDIHHKFLPINRKRRLDSASGSETKTKTEGGSRNVMGRKGLGKLAGFGAATKVKIRTKRKGETFATTITMDYGALGSADDLTAVTVPAVYEDDLPSEEQGTSITLSGLKSDAVKYSIGTIEHTLREAFFGIQPEEMEISLNGNSIKPETPAYEYVYPDGRGPDDLAEEDIVNEDLGSINVKFYVGFRKRGDNLPASRRGARIYCNNRLAAGPSLFGLPTGMHNFHSQSYMECVVRADDLDRYAVDLVNTNRTQLREDNELVRAVIERVEDIMKRALVAHSKFRDDSAERAIDTSPKTKVYASILDRMAPKARSSARRLLKTLASQHGVDSTEFEELAPLVIDSMNAGEVLIRLSELGHDPKSLQVVVSNLRELAEIEKSDALKLYRGRRSGINALLELINRGEFDLWKKKGIEKELHSLLKEEPWLIKPEYSRYLTSDVNLDTVARTLAQHLTVDSFAPQPKGEDDEEFYKNMGNTRPDLVFLMADADAPHLINVVELKSPSIPLDNSHLTQLETYMFKIEKYVSMELKRSVMVHGYLIGAMPDTKTVNDQELLLIDKIEKAGPESKWAVLGVRSLLERAKQIHLDQIKALESDLSDQSAGSALAAAEAVPAFEGPAPAEVTTTVH